MLRGMNGLCQHNQNPRACLACYNATVNAQPRSQPKPKMHMPRVHDVIKAVRVRDGQLGQADVEPTVPVHVGYNADGSPIKRAEDKPFHGPMPKPVMHPGPGSAAPMGKVMEPFSYANLGNKQKEIVVAGVKMTVDVPRKHHSLIDSLPQHPDAGGGRIR